MQSVSCDQHMHSSLDISWLLLLLQQVGPFGAFAYHQVAAGEWQFHANQVSCHCRAAASLKINSSKLHSECLQPAAVQLFWLPAHWDNVTAALHQQIIAVVSMQHSWCQS